jgi:hypothetical protein
MGGGWTEKKTMDGMTVSDDLIIFIDLASCSLACLLICLFA